MAGIDIFMSRREFFNECWWWKREDSWDANMLVHQKKPSGIFYAKEENPEQNRKEILNDVFQFDENTITLKTMDDISEMKSNDIVKYDGRVWMVSNIQRIKVKKQSQFLENTSYLSYLTLKS